jgi:hypothetical protein
MKEILLTKDNCIDHVSCRRESAMRVLQKCGLCRGQALLFGFKLRAQQTGIVSAAIKQTTIVLQDTIGPIYLFVNEL